MSSELSPFRQVMVFLTKLAWNSRVTLPMLVAAVFMAMDCRLQLEINLHTLREESESADDDDDDEEDDDETDDSTSSVSVSSFLSLENDNEVDEVDHSCEHMPDIGLRGFELVSVANDLMPVLTAPIDHVCHSCHEKDEAMKSSDGHASGVLKNGKKSSNESESTDQPDTSNGEVGKTEFVYYSKFKSE